MKIDKGGFEAGSIYYVTIQIAIETHTVILWTILYEIYSTDTARLVLDVQGYMQGSNKWYTSYD